MRTANRLARAKRLMALQEQMRRAAEWELAETRRRVEAADAQESALLGSLGDTAVAGLFLEAAARCLRTIAGERSALDAAAQRQQEAVRERALAQKRSERQVASLGAQARREDERRDLLERLDGLAAGGDASLP
ncbi:hypothetical protein [Methylobacterium sp. JK268]